MVAKIKYPSIKKFRHLLQRDHKGYTCIFCNQYVYKYNWKNPAGLYVKSHAWKCWKKHGITKKGKLFFAKPELTPIEI